MIFLKGEKEILGNLANDDLKYDELSSEFSKLLDISNLSFLFGAGCSSYYFYGVEDDFVAELGILTMQPLAQKYFAGLIEGGKEFLKKIHINFIDDKYFKNLEAYFEAILNYRNHIAQIQDVTVPWLQEHSDWINYLIKDLQNFILKECTAPFSHKDTTVIDLYKDFYRKLVFRDRNLPKPNVFTTNYDTFSEKAMDALSIHYANGFSGVLDRYFNPSVFEFAFSENLNLSDNKWQVIDHFVYLYKLHGSINWIEEKTEGQLYDVKEVQDTSYDILSTKKNILIYPSSAKQNTSLSSPYTDIFREFKSKLSKPNNVLIVVGYSFSDEHINTLIYQALAKPTFRLVVLGNPENFPQLQALKDPRIWLIGGKDSKDKNVHYFANFVKRIMPDLSEREIEESITKAIKNLVAKP
jgi:hypothetical protein